MRIDSPGGLAGGQGPEDLSRSQSPAEQIFSSIVAQVYQDAVERFQVLVAVFDQFLDLVQQNMQQGNLPDSQYNKALLRGLQQEVDKMRMQANLTGPLQDQSSSQKKSGQYHYEAGSTKSWGNLGLPDDPTSLGRDWETKGETLAEGEATLYRFGEIDESAAGEWGSAYIRGYSDFLSAQGRVYGDAGIEDGSLQAFIGAGGRATLVSHYYELGYSTPTINLAGHEIGLNTNVVADAWIGAQGNAEIGISLGKENRIKVGAEGFAGASASLAGSASLGEYAGVNAGVKAWAGVGAKAAVDIGFEDGKFNFDLGLGICLGVGLEIDLGFTIDFGAIADTIVDVGEEAIGFFGDVFEGVGGVVEDVAGGIGDFAEDVGDAVASAAEDVADAVGDAVDTVGDAISDVFDW